MVVTHLQRTNVTSMSTKPEFVEPIVWDEKFGCPLCSFEGKDEGDLKKHYQSDEHHEEFLKRMKGPNANSSFYEKDEDETEQEYSKRSGLAFVLGVLPSYVSITENQKQEIIHRRKRLIRKREGIPLIFIIPYIRNSFPFSYQSLSTMYNLLFLVLSFYILRNINFSKKGLPSSPKSVPSFLEPVSSHSRVSMANKTRVAN